MVFEEDLRRLRSSSVSSKRGKNTVGKKKSVIYTLALIIIITLSFAGCVPPEDSVTIQNDLLTIKNQLKSIQTRLDMTGTSSAKNEIGRIAEDVDAVKKNQADLRANISELSDNNQIFISKMDELNFRITELSKDIELLQQRLPQKAEDVISKAPEGEKDIALLRPDDIYRVSYNDYLKGNYDLAISGFQEYIKKFPDSKLAGNAQYWIAESYYSLKKFERAAEEFDKIIQNYPKNSKVPSAFLKKGYSYLELNRIDEAKELLKDLINRFPLTAEAKLAEEKLKTLGKN